jgi:hypothetical protein
MTPNGECRLRAMYGISKIVGGRLAAVLAGYAAVLAASIFAAHWGIVRLRARTGTGRLK